MAGWWADWDSNPDSKDYESSALTIKLSARLFAPLSRTWKKVTSDKWLGTGRCFQNDRRTADPSLGLFLS